MDFSPVLMTSFATGAVDRSARPIQKKNTAALSTVAKASVPHRRVINIGGGQQQQDCF